MVHFSYSGWPVKSLEILTVCVGAISAAAGCTVLLTFALFPSMLYIEKINKSVVTFSGKESSIVGPSKVEHLSGNSSPTNLKLSANVYTHMILMLALSETIASIAYSLGFSTDPTTCTVQGAIMMFFVRAKWVWSALIEYQLYDLMVNNKKGLKLWQLHAVAWGISLMLELLPLADDVTYGTDDESYGILVCYFRSPNAQAASDWFAAVFFAPLVCCMIFMFYYSIRIWFRFRYYMSADAQTEGTVEVNRLLKTMILYPISTLVTTAPNMIGFVLYLTYPEVSSPKTFYVSQTIMLCWSFTYGLFLCAIFFTFSQEAKRRWRLLLFGAPYTEVGNRLVRSDDAFKQVTAQISQIEESIDNFLDGASFNSNNSWSTGADSEKNAAVSPVFKKSKKRIQGDIADVVGSPKAAEHLALSLESNGIAGSPMHLPNNVFFNDSANSSPLHKANSVDKL